MSDIFFGILSISVDALVNLYV